MKSSSILDQVLNNMIGFDRLHNHNYPPYNIFKEEDGVVLEIACSGFKKEDLKVYLEGNTLVVEGHKPEPPVHPYYIYRGLAHRSWRHQFHLSNKHRVESVTHTNGVLLVKVASETKDTLPLNIEIKWQHSPPHTTQQRW